MIKKTLSLICGAFLILGLSTAVFSMSGCNDDSSSHIKQAGQEAGNAAKDTGQAIKEGINEGAKKVEQSTD